MQQKLQRYIQPLREFRSFPENSYVWLASFSLWFSHVITFFYWENTFITIRSFFSLPLSISEFIPHCVIEQITEKSPNQFSIWLQKLYLNSNYNFYLLWIEAVFIARVPRWNPCNISGLCNFWFVLQLSTCLHCLFYLLSPRHSI